MRTFFGALLLLGSMSQVASANLLRVLHTNDLHSYFEHGDEPDKGGYESLRHDLDMMTNLSTAQNIPTLRVDAGDFSEGHLNFMAKQGRASFELMSLLGYEAITLGNHDWLMGVPDLLTILSEQTPKLPILAANLHCANPRTQAELSRVIRPYIERRYGSGNSRVRIAILGLTTPDILFSWRLLPDCTVRDPLEVLDEFIPWLRRNNDFVFVLSHLGFFSDIDFARASTGVDLIIGGHSHTVLNSAEVIRNRANIPVPIVQAGQHGEMFGDLLLDLFPGSPLQILDYNLHEVLKEPSQFQSPIAQKIAEMRNELVTHYGAPHLKAIVGTSEVPLHSPKKTTTPWGYFVAEAFRQTAQAEIGIDVERFHGDQFDGGVIEREKIMRFYPRFFELNRKHGWHVFRVTASAVFIKEQLQYLMAQGMPFSIAGFKIDWRVNMENGVPTIEVSGLRWLNGTPIPISAWISIGMPEGIVRGGLLSQPVLSGLVLRNPLDTRVSIWSSIERHLRRNQFVVRAQQEGFTEIPFNEDVGN